MPPVMAIQRNEQLWVMTDQGPLPVRADRLASQVDPAAGVRGRAGDGAQGPRVSAGATVALRPLRAPGQGHGLRARRSMAPPDAWACYVGCGPADTGLEALIRVAGTRWAIEACCAEAQGEMGLDPYEVRRWDGWYRHITLAMLAHASWAVIRQQAVPPGKKGGPAARMQRGCR